MENIKKYKHGNRKYFHAYYSNVKTELRLNFTKYEHPIYYCKICGMIIGTTKGNLQINNHMRFYHNKILNEFLEINELKN